MSYLPSVSCHSCSLPLSLVLLTDCCLVAKSCLTLCDHMHARLPCPSLSPRVYSNSCLLSQWCYLTTHPLLPPLLHLPSIFPSISVFSELALHIRWPKNWSFSNRPFSVYSGFISFRIDWFDFLAVQRTLKTRNYKTPRGEHRQNSLRHKSQQDPLWPTSQNIRNKSKNKQMGPNET